LNSPEGGTRPESKGGKTALREGLGKKKKKQRKGKRAQVVGVHKAHDSSTKRQAWGPPSRKRSSNKGNNDEKRAQKPCRSISPAKIDNKEFQKDAKSKGEKPGGRERGGRTMSNCKYTARDAGRTERGTNGGVLGIRVQKKATKL